jgi:Spy/CpxP family protein refolding chaperone
MNLKRLILSAVVLSAIGATSFVAPAVAQVRQGPDRTTEARVDQRVQHMTRALDLSPEQQAQIRSIFKEQTGAIPDRPRRAQAEQVRQRAQLHREAVEAILSPEQREQLTELREERRSQERPRRQMPARGTLIDQLDLTEAQKAQIAELRTAQRAEMQQNRVTRERGARGRMVPGQGAAWGPQSRETIEAIEAVLTPNQRQQWEDMRTRQRGEAYGSGRRGPRSSR